jgi:hypothetical protein
MAAFDPGMMCLVDCLGLYKIAHSRKIQHYHSPLSLPCLRMDAQGVALLGMGWRTREL